MKRLFVVSTVIVLFVIAFSCEGGNSTLEVDCSNCFVQEPDSFDLITSLSISDGLYDSAFVQFYKGRIESEDLSWEGMVYTQEFLHFVPVNEYYSVKATYTKDGKSVVAVDGDRMVSRYIADACDSDCWIVKGQYRDVRLKY